MVRYTLMKFQVEVNSTHWTQVEALDLDEAVHEAAVTVARSFDGVSRVVIRHLPCPLWPAGLEYAFETEKEKS